jgi:hypothetical protein
MFYPVVDSETETVPTIEGFKGLIIENNRLNYKTRDGETEQINLKNTEDDSSCNP